MNKKESKFVTKELKDYYAQLSDTDRKKIEETAQKLEEYYSQFPNWYWKYGLHDAFILSVSELQLALDRKEKKPKFNCLEIELDSDAAYESDIKKIRLYNYEIKTPNIEIKSINKSWWIGDTIKELHNKHYLLELETESTQGGRKHFVIEFEFPEIERN